MEKSKQFLTLKDICFSYNGIHDILTEINFSLKGGEILGVIGPNGSGKTTLLNVISGILKPKKGVILVQNQNLSLLSIEKIAKFISVVPQNTWVTFNFKAEEVVFMGTMPFISRIKGECAKDYQISREAMKKTHCLSLSGKNIQHISGGERQRVFWQKL